MLLGNTGAEVDHPLLIAKIKIGIIKMLKERRLKENGICINAKVMRRKKNKKRI